MWISQQRSTPPTPFLTDISEAVFRSNTPPPPRMPQKCTGACGGGETCWQRGRFQDQIDKSVQQTRVKAPLRGTDVDPGSGSDHSEGAAPRGGGGHLRRPALRSAPGARGSGLKGTVSLYAPPLHHPRQARGPRPFPSLSGEANAEDGKRAGR